MAAVFNHSSLRGKITSAYFLLVVGTAVLGVIAFSDLLFLQRQVAEGEVVADLKDAVIGMRQEEKNMFLYADVNALGRAEEFVKLSLAMVAEHHATLATITQEPSPTTISDALQQYQRELHAWSVVGEIEQAETQDKIRALGHQVTLLMTALSTQERRAIQTAVRESQWFLLAALLMIGLSIYLVGRRISRVVVAPLHQLETSLTPIAEGRFSQMISPSDDREFVTFTNAFNKMLKELEIRQKRLLQSEKLASLGVLASGVAHELNNPLSNISSSCQLLIEELDNAKPAQLKIWLNQIEGETERGRKIVRTLLDFGCQGVFQKQQLQLIDILDEVKIILGNNLQRFSAQLAYNVPDELILNVDKQRMLQLFINLIQNALHAGGQDVEIIISAIVCDRNMPLIADDAQVAGNLKCINENQGRFIEILIADNGPGISNDTLPNVFDPFFTTSQPGHGVGLGLSIVQEIVREHDGCLAITSRVDGGTKVIVLLPEQQEEEKND